MYIFRFIEVFRLSKEVTRRLIESLTPHLYVRTRDHGIPTEIIVLTALRFFATGCYQRSVGQDFNCDLSQTSVHRCIKEVTLAIYRHLSRQYIKFPTTFRERQQLKLDFMNKFGFPGTIGAIDCTHVAILKPTDEEHNFINRKGYHSLNVQMICDPDLKILNINANFGGSTHDSFIWRNSDVNVYLNDLRLQERNTWLIGDNGYPLQPHLFTPIANPQGLPEQAFNNAHARARNVIERCFGILQTRFRCLMKERVARYAPEYVASMIIFCAVLHNICVDNGIPSFPNQQI